jgi:hypothetical protein
MLDTITLVKIADIIVPPDRMRRLRPEVVNTIAESMNARGQLQPIIVRPCRDGFILVAGWHRLEAGRKLGWETIDTCVLDGTDVDEMQIIEIDENLMRAELSTIERALHLAERKELYEKLHPETKATKAGGPGRAKGRLVANIGDELAERFTKDVAKKTDRSERTLQREIARADIPGLRDAVGTSLDQGDELDRLAKLPEPEQRGLIERARAGEKVSARTRLKQVARQERERELGAKQCAFPDKKHGVIVGDPGWDDDVWSRETGMNKHAANHYTTEDLQTIKAWPVKDMAADDCVLFLWSTNQHMRQAMDVMEAWGFNYVSHYVWYKEKSPGMVFGTGRDTKFCSSARAGKSHARRRGRNGNR